MSHFTTERVLWDLTSKPENIQKFVANADAFLTRYGLSDDERILLKEQDVRALADRGNSQMLLMLFWLAVHGGFQSLPEYLGRMNAPAQ